MMPLYATFSKAVLVYCIVMVLGQLFRESKPNSNSYGNSNSRRFDFTMIPGAMAQDAACEVGPDGASTCINNNNNDNVAAANTEGVESVAIPMHKY